MSAPGADPLAAIRKRFNTPTVESRLQMLCDISDLLTQWDTRESALRALVAQWREEVQETKAKFTASGVNPFASTGLQVLTSCADELERLLSGPQPTPTPEHQP